MPTLLDRRLPRIDFRTPIWMTLPPDDERVAGQALNLSERGLFIGTEHNFTIGSTLRLSLPLDQGQLDVGGRVTWARPFPRAGAPAGFGIEFTDLDASGLERLKNIIGSDREHGIRVRFSGLPAPIRARASVQGDGLSLHTELPFLRLGSPADFSLEGDAESHRGRIRRVSIEPGGSSDVPRLRIEVDVLGVGGVDGEESDEPAVPVPASEADTDETEMPPAIEVPRAAPQWIEPTMEVSTERIVRSSRTPGPFLITTTAAVIGFIGTFALLGASTGSDIASPTIHVPAVAPPSAAVTTVAHEAPALAAPETSDIALKTTVAGANTIVKFALAAGTADGLSHYLLSSPSGVAINLPAGTLIAARKVHWTEAGHAKKIWIREYDGGDQVRIFFPDAASRDYRVDTSGALITVTITQ